MQAVTKDGQPRFTIRFPKFKKGDHSVRKEKTPASYGNIFHSFCGSNGTFSVKICIKCITNVEFILGYTEVLLDMLVNEYDEDPKSLRTSIQALRDSIPPPLAASFEKPNKDIAVEQYVSRFAEN